MVISHDMSHCSFPRGRVSLLIVLDVHKSKGFGGGKVY